MIVNASIQALATEDAKFDLSHVQPAHELRGVVKLHATQELNSRTMAKRIVKALSEVHIQAFQYQVNSSRLGVCTREQLFDEGDEVKLSSTLGDRNDSLPSLRLDSH